MKRKDKALSKEKAFKEMKYHISRRSGIAAIVSAIAATWFTVISINLPVPIDEMNICQWLHFLISYAPPVLLSVWGIFLLFKNYLNAKKFEKEYMYYTESKKISTALLTAIKRTHFEKTRNILQSTYGKVPDWHPINYNDNILVYDIHQHLRSICIRLKELVVGIAPNEFNDDMVTVDIAFQYPSDNKFIKIVLADQSNNRGSDIREKQLGGSVQECGELESTNSDKELAWKIITSGDRTSSSVNMHAYLSDTYSFYSYLANQGYVFSNDKKQLAEGQHYIWTSHDRQYENIGSVIGTVIELKNDNPETVFVKAYLTIGTFGRKLVEENDPLDEEHFEKLFKETIINSYKTLIEAELAQMFIRHGIKQSFINRTTGKLILKN